MHTCEQGIIRYQLWVRASVCVRSSGGGEQESLSTAVWVYFLTGQRGEACCYEWVNRGCICQSAWAR